MDVVVGLHATLMPSSTPIALAHSWLTVLHQAFVGLLCAEAPDGMDELEHAAKQQLLLLMLFFGLLLAGFFCGRSFPYAPVPPFPPCTKYYELRELTRFGPIKLKPISTEAIKLKIDQEGRYTVNLSCWALRAVRRAMPWVRRGGRISPFSPVKLSAVERRAANVPENASSLAFVYPLDGIALSDDTGRDGLDELHKPGRGFRERLYALLPGAVKKKASAESSLILFGVGS